VAVNVGEIVLVFLGVVVELRVEVGEPVGCAVAVFAI
jgi:hypothetical protein